MNNSLTIPDNIQVGFQDRTDTYTGKLAYVVYKDSTGKMRKEKSWTGWCSKKIPKEVHNNEPVSGFVLNKDVGGTRHSYGSWNARVEKVRVYDPRGFEFEIDIPNLLFILQESSSIKGKGLEGDFVYSWSGPNLVLLPVTSQEYKESVVYNQLQTEKLTKSDMEVGCLYLTKKRQNVMYMGKLPWFDAYQRYSYKNIFGKKMQVFALMDTPRDERNLRSHYLLTSGFTGLAKRMSTTPSPQYADEYSFLMKQTFISIPVSFETKPMTATSLTSYWDRNICVEKDGEYYVGAINEEYHGYGIIKKPKSYHINCPAIAQIIKGQYVPVSCSSLQKSDYVKSGLSREEALAIGKKLFVICENGAKYEVHN